MLDKDARRSEVEPGTEQLLEDTGGVQRWWRSRSKVYETAGKAWSRGLHCLIQNISDAGLQELLVGVNEHVADRVLVGDADIGHVEATQRLLGSNVAWLRWVHGVLLMLIRRHEVHRVAADSLAELLGVGGSRGGLRAVPL